MCATFFEHPEFTGLIGFLSSSGTSDDRCSLFRIRILTQSQHSRGLAGFIRLVIVVLAIFTILVCWGLKDVFVRLWWCSLSAWPQDLE